MTDSIKKDSINISNLHVQLFAESFEVKSQKDEVSKGYYYSIVNDIEKHSRPAKRQHRKTPFK